MSVQDRSGTYIKDGSGSESAVYYSGYTGFEDYVIMEVGATCTGRLKSFKKIIVRPSNRPKLNLGDVQKRTLHLGMYGGAKNGFSV